MSGSPIVDLAGASMTALVHAIPETQARTGKPVVVIGGLAVICRVSGPHRATSDLDTVNRRRAGEPSQLQVLVTSTGRASGPAGVLIPTALGEVQVDILEVSDADFDPLPEDPTGRLHVLSHAWAADTATAVLIRAQDGNEIIVAVAEPGPLVAMKLQSTFDRGTDKASTDLLDIIRLTLGDRTRSEHPAFRQLIRCSVPTEHRTSVSRGSARTRVRCGCPRRDATADVWCGAGVRGICPCE